MNNIKKNTISKMFVLNVLLIFAMLILVVLPFIGIKNIPINAIIQPPFDSVDFDIYWNIRVPRVCISFLAGSGLALSGMVFQAMFRNPIATPFTLGIASGASLGTAIYVQSGFTFWILGISGISIFAFLGAILSIFLVYGLSIIKRGFSTTTMLLAGVAISFFFSSLILFIQYISDFTQSFHIIRWLMGRLDILGFEPVFNMAPFVITGSIIIFYLSHELNLMTSGEDIAISRGVDTGKIKKILFFATSLMVGGVVAICGPIGFVGMISPHICRLLIGTDHRYLAPVTFLFGGIFLTLCDTVARTLIAPTEIPVGIITALLGGPFFIWLLLGKNSIDRKSTSSSNTP